MQMVILIVVHLVINSRKINKNCESFSLLFVYLDGLVYPGHDVSEQPGVERPAEGVPGAPALAGAELRHQAVGAELQVAGEEAAAEAVRIHPQQLTDIVQF